jgi:hypothetical protein
MVAFCCYDPSGTGNGGIHEWYGEQVPEICAQIDAALEALAHAGRVDELPFKALRGACKGLTEIIIEFETDDEEILIRILGFGSAKEFFLLVGFRKTANADYGLPVDRPIHGKPE